MNRESQQAAKITPMRLAVIDIVRVELPGRVIHAFSSTGESPKDPMN